jgi:hypothetical protein
VQNGNILTTPFLDISSKKGDNEWGGIFGFTFHPNHVSNQNATIKYLQVKGNLLLHGNRVLQLQP